MATCENSLDGLLARARHDSVALGSLLEYYRPYLRVTARKWLNGNMAARGDRSDIVQQTCVEAVEQFPEFLGASEPEFSAWIMRIHRHAAINFARTHLGTQKRSVLREQPQYAPDGSASFSWYAFAGDDSAPSKRLILGERALRLAQVLESLPERQCQALRMRFFDGMPLRAIGQAMEASTVAVAALLKNGLRNLRGRLNDDSWL